MSRPRAENRLSENERAALSQAIRSIVVHEGSYVSVVCGAQVSQPVVSLALHQRLVVKTPSVIRLFEYLGIGRLTSGTAQIDEPAMLTGKVDRVRRLVGMLEGLSDGSREADERLATVLAALQGFLPMDAR
jgi:hypothetical protein